MTKFVSFLLLLLAFTTPLHAQQCSTPYFYNGYYTYNPIQFPCGSSSSVIAVTRTTHVTDQCIAPDNITVYASHQSVVTGNGQYHCGGTGHSNLACYADMEQVSTTATSPTDYNRFYNQAYDAIYLVGSGTCQSGSNIGFRQDFWQCLGVACPPPKCFVGCGGSPIILDLNGNGFNLTSVENGVKFDISGNGNAVQMGWTAADADNAFLALPGTDGLVHSGKELFGNFTAQPPSDHPNGFAALAVFDDPKNGGNGDGVIDSHDAVFASLRLWIDTNHDGISQPNELHRLPSLGINSFSLKYKEADRTDQYGNVFRYKARLNPDRPTDAGKTAYDVFFVVSSPSTTKNILPDLGPADTTRKCRVPVSSKGALSSTGSF